MNPANELAKSDRLEVEIHRQIDAICLEMNAQAEEANRRGENSTTYEITTTFDLGFPDPEMSRTFIYGMIVEELERQKYFDITYTRPKGGKGALIHFAWARNYSLDQLQKYKQLLQKHQK